MSLSIKTDLRSLKAAIREFVERQSSDLGSARSYLEAQKIEFDKWRLIHKLVHATPFRTRKHLARSQQWREVVPYARSIGEIEVLEWIILQVEVAQNLERGIQDLRPRKNGPCHGLLLEYVADRKRKAHAVLHFAIAEDEKGALVTSERFRSYADQSIDSYSGKFRAEDNDVNAQNEIKKTE